MMRARPYPNLHFPGTPAPHGLVRGRESPVRAPSPRGRYTAVELKRRYISAAKQLVVLAVAAASAAPEGASGDAAALLDSMGDALAELIGLVPASIVERVREYEQRARPADALGASADAPASSP